MSDGCINCDDWEGNPELAVCGECWPEKIERLRKELAIIEKPTGILEMQRMLDEANERIEELSDACYQKQEIINGYEDGGVHWNSNEQINRAWRMANDDVLYSVEQCKLMVWILKKLGIVRCEGCVGGGEYIAVTDEHGHPWPVMRLRQHACPACAPWGSKGWRIGGEDE